MERFDKNEAMMWLDMAHTYALHNSGCTKVQVGAAIVNEIKNGISFGANVTAPNKCQTSGCLRVAKYGDNAKKHRLPGDCRAVHSEVEAIIAANTDLRGCTIYVTRYPCEACARAICLAGITSVVYGRAQEISAETLDIFNYYMVDVHHVKDWSAEDITT